MAHEKHRFTFNEQITAPFTESFAAAAGARGPGRAIDAIFLDNEELNTYKFLTYWIPSRLLLRGPAALAGAILGGTVGRGVRSAVKSVAERTA